ncbi:MAG: polysaccharide biosynthesis protein [Ignavibacteriae bacterium]|nr:polysaccharide biosynthesis protein [Ignavibacteriota bacterium]
MFEKIKRLGTDTAIYGISTILGRFLTFLLTPLYANILPPSDVGIIATMYAYIAFLNVMYSYGMDSAYMKYTSTLELGNAKQTFTIPFLSLTLTSVLISILLFWQAETLTGVINLSSSLKSVTVYAALILCLDAISLVPFASLRMERKAKQFAAIKLVTIVVNVCCNVVFLIMYRMGVEGVFLSGVVSSALAVVLLLPTILRQLTLSLPSRVLAPLLRFGLPYVPAGLATMMIQVIDRPILEALTDKATVGIYQANYRLGIFMMLIVSMYDFAWRPFFLSHARDTEAKELFARVLTYFVLLMAAVFLVLSFFLENIVKWPVFWGRSILPEAYWSGLDIVPVVLLAYVFLGISNNMVAGIYIEKKTQHLPAITFIGAAVNVAANLALIPIIGIMGAALATLMSYAAMATVLYFTVQKYYAVKYEFERLAKIVVAAAIVFGLYLLVELDSFELVWKVALLILFVVIMHWMKFFQSSELKRLAMIFRRGTTNRKGSDLPVDIGA